MFTSNKNNYGYGWFIGTQFNQKFVEQGGGINGFNTQITRYTDAKVTVIVLGNMNTKEIGAIATGLAALVFELETGNLRIGNDLIMNMYIPRVIRDVCCLKCWD
jgi:hypothetical protein